MLSYLIKRLLVMVPTLLGVVTMAFLITQFVPGGPVEQTLLEMSSTGGGEEGSGGGADASSYVANQSVSPQQVEQLRVLYGLDRPPLERYWKVLERFSHFDLGDSYYLHQSVWSLIRAKLPVSLTLGLWTFVVTYLISVPLGVAKAVRRGSRFDFLSSVVVLIVHAIPGFVLGVLLLVLFGGGTFWEVFPLRGLTSDHWDQLSRGAQIVDYLWHIVLPVTTLAASSLAVTTLLTRNSVLEQIGRQYVLALRAKGLPEGRILSRHVLRNALLPLVTGFPTHFLSAFFTGSLLIETLFSLDGLGLLSFDSVMRRDYPVVLGTLYLFALIGLVIKLLGDLCYVLVDPRIKFDARPS